MQGYPKDLLDNIQHHLNDELKRISQRIGELMAQDPFSNSDRLIDNAASDTEANEESSHDRNSAIVEELKNQSDNLKKALARISDGSYGFCQVCRQMIDTDRLSILPTATLCLSCEKKRKKSHK